MASGKTSLPDAARDLNSAAIHLLRGLRAADRVSGLTPARLSALSVLVFGGPGTLGRLARTEDVSGPTMTRIVAALEEAGLATRQADESDRRVARITITPAGRKFLSRHRSRKDLFLADRLEKLTPRETKVLLDALPILERLVDDDE